MNCPRGFKTIDEIYVGMSNDENHECDKCPNMKYYNGILSCPLASDIKNNTNTSKNIER